MKIELSERTVAVIKDVLANYINNYNHKSTDQGQLIEVAQALGEFQGAVRAVEGLKMKTYQIDTDTFNLIIQMLNAYQNDSVCMSILAAFNTQYSENEIDKLIRKLKLLKTKAFNKKDLRLIWNALCKYGIHYSNDKEITSHCQRVLEKIKKGLKDENISDK